MTFREQRQVEEDAAYLASSWPLLVLLGTPGGRDVHAHRSGPPSDEVKQRAAAEAAQDAAEARKPGYVRPGAHPVPIATNLLDLLAEIVHVSSDVAETVSQVAGVDHLGSPSSSWADPRPYLHQATAWLQPAQEADAATVPWVARELHALADKVAGYLGELHDGQVLVGICPWCRGRTEEHPEGGERTLVVYARLSRREQAGWDDDEPRGPRARRRAEPLIVCKGLNCTPPDSDVGEWVGHDEESQRPAWPPREWDWLAKRLLLPERSRA